MVCTDDSPVFICLSSCFASLIQQRGCQRCTPRNAMSKTIVLLCHDDHLFCASICTCVYINLRASCVTDEFGFIADREKDNLIEWRSQLLPVDAFGVCKLFFPKCLVSYRRRSAIQAVTRLILPMPKSALEQRVTRNRFKSITTHEWFPTVNCCKSSFLPMMRPKSIDKVPMLVLSTDRWSSLITTINGKRRQPIFNSWERSNDFLSSRKLYPIKPFIRPKPIINSTKREINDQRCSTEYHQWQNARIYLVSLVFSPVCQRRINANKRLFLLSFAYIIIKHSAILSGSSASFRRWSMAIGIFPRGH